MAHSFRVWSVESKAEAGLQRDLGEEKVSTLHMQNVERREEQERNVYHTSHSPSGPSLPARPHHLAALVSQQLAVPAVVRRAYPVPDSCT